MIELTGKQKRRLRSLGQRLQASVTVGKGGPSQEWLTNLSALLARHELVKVKLPAAASREREAMAEELAGQTGSACAGVLGRTALLYRPSPDLPADQRIRLD